jgi:exodeoxyribonuclease-3
LSDLGYHLYISGQKSYNGVAILSRTPLRDVSTGFTPLLGDRVNPVFDEQKRLITGVIDNVRILNLYVPNGGGGIEKYDFKLQWLSLLREYVQKSLHEPPPICMCGDFNIAPEDRDIHDPIAAANQVMATEPERQALQSIVDLGLLDPFRKFTAEGGHFSWWDYRAAAFRRNLGWRIDHHYLTETLHNQAKRCWIDDAPRKLSQPSDHAPVIVEL